MKKNATDITIVLDRSGSMSSVREDTIGGFNTFLSEQKALPGECTFTLVQFDDQYEVHVDGKNIQDVKNLTLETYQPRGWTALLDAIGKTIVKTGERLAALPEDQRPEKVIFVIQTDGQENASKEFTRGVVFDMIARQREKYNWQFVFLGANQDAIAAAAQYGIGANASMSYAHTGVGTQRALRSTSRVVGAYRSGMTADMSFSADDRKQQDDLLKSPVK